MANYLSKTNDERKRMKDLQIHLKVRILSRISDKDKFIDVQAINNLMDDIKTTQMAIEAELEDIRDLYQMSSQQNTLSK